MEISFHTSSAGENYVGSFLEELSDKKAVKQILKRLEKFEKHGVSFLNYSGTIKKLQGYDLYEIKIDFNHVFYRILCVIRGATCWLLNIFAKKSNKTPLHEIKTALNRARDLDIFLGLAVN